MPKNFESIVLCFLVLFCDPSYSVFILNCNSILILIVNCYSFFLFRSLPNWTNLQIEDNEEEISHEFEESPEEIRFRNKEESELLIRNLSCKDSISTCEIISDHNKLRNLALMHESMVSLDYILKYLTTIIIHVNKIV